MIRLSWVYAIVLVFLIIGYLVYGMLITEEVPFDIAFAVGAAVLIFGGVVALIVYFKLFPAKKCQTSVEIFKNNIENQSESS